MRTLLDLILPFECGGCAAPGSAWCAGCRAVLEVEPIPVAPRVDPGVPCWALGNYAGPRRRAVIVAKERGRRDLAEPLGVALGVAVGHLRRWGELDPPELAPLLLVPAPTRARAARVRGGDPVTRAALAAAAVVRRCEVARMLALGRGARDSVGLSAQQRRDNLAGRLIAKAPREVLPDGTNVVLVDDVLTTGATAAESVASLAGIGLAVSAVLVIAAA